MSVTLRFKKNIVIVTFYGDIEKNKIRDSFIDITEKVRIKTISYIVFDFLNIKSYSAPKNFMSNHKTITHFSSTWNENIKAITVATHPEIRSIINGFITNKSELKWEYSLVKTVDEAYKIC